MSADRICRCGKPTRDQVHFCDDCGHALSVALGEVPWLAEELETTITRTKGVDYRTKGGSGGSERPSPVLWAASEARTALHALLVSWVRYSHDEKVRNQSPTQDLPADNLTALSRYLLWRVDGLALLDIGPEAVDEITDAVAACHRLIDSPGSKQYLGNCDLCDGGRLYARQGSRWARCDACDAASDAQERRDKLLDELDDRLCTAAEIARLSTYLGLKADREQVRQRINQWHKRDRISREHAFADEPVFRFGIVWRMLMQAEEVKVS